MNVRKSRNLGITFILCGVVIMILSVALGKLILTISGVLIVIFGIPYLTGKLFTYDRQNKKITVFALLGPASKEYIFDSIVYENGIVSIFKDGNKKRLPLSRGICEKEDWEHFINEIGKKD